MKSTFAIIAVLVSIAIGLPVKAENTQLGNRLELIAFLSYAECYVGTGMYSKEVVDKNFQSLLNVNPHLKAEYLWASTSPKVKQVLLELSPHMNSKCDDYTISDDQLRQIFSPILE